MQHSFLLVQDFGRKVVGLLFMRHLLDNFALCGRKRDLCSSVCLNKIAVMCISCEVLIMSRLTSSIQEPVFIFALIILID